jgi:hypothetical protein
MDGSIVMTKASPQCIEKNEKMKKKKEKVSQHNVGSARWV